MKSRILLGEFNDAIYLVKKILEDDGFNLVRCKLIHKQLHARKLIGFQAPAIDRYSHNPSNIQIIHQVAVVAMNFVLKFLLAKIINDVVFIALKGCDDGR